MKKRLTTYFFLIAALGIALASIFGVWSYREREVASARQTLSELLALMEQHLPGSPDGPHIS